MLSAGFIASSLQVFVLWSVLLATAANFAIALLIQLNHLSTIFRKPKTFNARNREAIEDEPFISIHVPTYDEPPELVIATLNSLAKLDYKAFEVIVLDNNTPSPKTWAPVEQACRALGPNFRFYHFDGVKGAKAGALNLGLGLCHASARYVAVVDADYQVCEDFLSRAVDTLRDTRAVFVQFPQAYRGVGPEAKFVESELSDYFDAFAPRANNNRSMLLTGTLSVLSLKDLKEIGGWSGATVTEDAELGVRFFENHLYGVYNPNIVGRGLLPLSFKSLTDQRRRWVTGNLQTLFAMLRRTRLAASPPGFATVVAQLTAWPTFWLLPIVNLAVIACSDGVTHPVDLIRDISAGTILIVTAGVGARLCLDVVTRTQSLEGVASMLAVKLALAWTSSTAFLPAIWQRSVAFVRTSKRPGEVSTTSRIDANLVLGGVGLACSMIYAHSGSWVAAMACLLLAGTAPASFWVDRRLQRYAASIAQGPDRLLPPRNKS